MAEMGIVLVILGLGMVLITTYVKIGMWLWCKLDDKEKSSLLPPWRKRNEGVYETKKRGK